MMNASSDLSKDCLRRVKATGQGNIFPDAGQSSSNGHDCDKKIGEIIFRCGTVLKGSWKTGCIQTKAFAANFSSASCLALIPLMYLVSKVCGTVAANFRSASCFAL